MTVYNRTIQIRLTQKEKSQIEERMKAEGFHNMSAWLRRKLLSNPVWMEQKIDEIHRCVKMMSADREE